MDENGTKYELYHVQYKTGNLILQGRDSLMLTISGETSPQDTETKGGGLFNDEDSPSGRWTLLGQSVWED
ncbi:MAG: hypothetical protein J5965_19855 [Aeriscardovia sp.]|nr:hypothetical protein [Aeriscardovia sp.]